MARTPTNWTLNAYTDSAWTDVVTDAGVVATILLVNTSGSPVNVQMRLTDDTPSELARVIPTTELAAGEAKVLDVRSLSVMINQRIQFFADAAGVHTLVSGAV